MQKSHNLHLTSWLKQQLLTPQKNLVRKKTLIYQIDNVDSVFHTSFILGNNTEARQTPVIRSQGRKINNDEEIEKLAFCLDLINIQFS